MFIKTQCNLSHGTIGNLFVDERKIMAFLFALVSALESELSETILFFLSISFLLLTHLWPFSVPKMEESESEGVHCAIKKCQEKKP